MAVTLGWTASCAQILALEDTTNIPEVNETFSCRDVPFPELSATETVDFTLKVVNLIDQRPYEGLTVQACSNLDAMCTEPIGQTTTDAAGDFTLTLPEGFLGHLFIPPPAEEPDLAPLNAHIFPPPSNDPAVPTRPGLVVTTLELFDQLAQLAGSNLVAGTGHLFFTAIDCQGLPLEGVAVGPLMATPDTLVVYLGASGQPDLSLNGTGTTGQGAILNVPTGFVTLRGVHQSEGALFEQSVIVSSDTITSAPIVPSPTE